MDETDFRLLEAIQNGLPICSRPYETIARQLSLNEAEVIERLQYLKMTGLIKRLGVIVNHRKLGFTANAMIVWDVPKNRVDEAGHKISQMSFVSLCYQRPRQLPEWPYNLYCMIHGKNKQRVLQQLDELIEHCDLAQYPREILFSKRCFKQRGAVYKLLSKQLAGIDG